MAVSPNTNFTAGQILTAQQANNWPRGVMGYVDRTAGNITVTTTIADLTGMTVTFTAEANRLYQATWQCTGTKDTTAGITAVYLTDSANTKIGSTNVYQIAGGFASLNGAITFSTTAGSKTYKLRADTNINTFTAYAVATLPLQFTITDLGPI
jgi:hypothetical protein